MQNPGHRPPSVTAIGPHGEVVGLAAAPLTLGPTTETNSRPRSKGNSRSRSKGDLACEMNGDENVFQSLLSTHFFVER